MAKTAEKEQTRTGPRNMTDEHKAALAKGRRQARSVRDYLAALEGEKPTKEEESIDFDARMAEIDRKIAEQDDPAKRVVLIQERLDIERQREDVKELDSFAELESAFVDVVREYSERKGISYKAWREAGVPAKTLREAGMKLGGNN